VKIEYIMTLNRASKPETRTGPARQKETTERIAQPGTSDGETIPKRTKERLLGQQPQAMVWMQELRRGDGRKEGVEETAERDRNLGVTGNVPQATPHSSTVDSAMASLP
jgi:hypothetical protein